ncbi:hypothetical protein IB238_15305 [Rhizobium sp. ARZ01]|uniref:hypothetical protein n=1 Tax=Rhizobium sp. ARZ01 TaxID=2769313 RepID=UPI001782E13E|nr:hypothetical protein [Rhizobium sp. ARZ01]MBD9373989.1 hypothetical protein [Rhizobium sp. ARZ01]
MQGENQGREAGALILDDLEVFNQSKLCFEKEVQTEVWRQIMAYLEAWTNSNRLSGEAEAPTYFFFCPPSWNLGDDLGHVAWFEFQREGEEDSYNVADLCGVGTGRVGLRFKFATKLFGGRRNWLMITKRDEFVQFIERLNFAGFVSDTIGELYMQVIIPPSDIAAAWRSRDWKTALIPLGESLELVKANLDLFIEFVDWARSVSGQPDLGSPAVT